ncbi:hypothetical protein D047_4447B, partial [Vibrio parahaemolyticus VPTS-2010_2]
MIFSSVVWVQTS